MAYRIPDAEQSIRNAARKLTIARNEVVMAHNRLNNYLEQEVPGRAEAEPPGC